MKGCGEYGVDAFAGNRVARRGLEHELARMEQEDSVLQMENKLLRL